MEQPQYGSSPIHWVPAALPPRAWEDQRPLESAPRYAGFWRRFVASCIDGFLLGIVNVIVSRVLEGILNRTFAGDPDVDSIFRALAVWLAAYFVVYTAVDWLYYAVQESSSRQATLGKRALGIVVTDLAGGRISFGRATGRYFAKYLSLLSLGIGYLVQPFTKKRQALHDAVAGTVVVRV